MKGIKQLILSCMLGVGTLTPMQAQQVQGFVHEQSKATDYVWPTDQQVLDKLDKWQDQRIRNSVYCSIGDYTPFQVLWNHGLSARKMWIGFREIQP